MHFNLECCEVNLISPLRFHEWFQSWGETKGQKIYKGNFSDLNFPKNQNQKEIHQITKKWSNQKNAGTLEH